MAFGQGLKRAHRYGVLRLYHVLTTFKACLPENIRPMQKRADLRGRLGNYRLQNCIQAIHMELGERLHFHGPNISQYPHVDANSLQDIHRRRSMQKHRGEMWKQDIVGNAITLSPTTNAHAGFTRACVRFAAVGGALLRRPTLSKNSWKHHPLVDLF